MALQSNLGAASFLFLYYKRMKKPFIFSALLGCFIIFLFSCQGNKNNENLSSGQQKNDIVSEAKFPFPHIPDLLQEPTERKQYLLLHYWDAFDFTDTVLLARKDITEQAFANQLALLMETSTTDSLLVQSIDNLCRRMECEDYACKLFMQMAENYLYQSDSPYYNEHIYAVFLKRMLVSTCLDADRKGALCFYLELIQRNNPGDKATDFSYFLPNGKKCSLAQTVVRGNYLLLVFYDPECTSCHAVLEEMISDTRLQGEISSGRITVLAVYTEDNETVWRSALSEMPHEWIVGQDKMQVHEGALYDIKAMPSLYLLDSEKRILLKDVSYRKICDFLETAITD